MLCTAGLFKGPASFTDTDHRPDDDSPKSSVTLWARVVDGKIILIVRGKPFIFVVSGGKNGQALLL